MGNCKIAKLVERQRLALDQPLEEWFDHLLPVESIRVVDLSQSIIIESTRLPQPFHRDPADQLIVATARVYDLTLMTEDSRILEYPGVKTI